MLVTPCDPQTPPHQCVLFATLVFCFSSTILRKHVGAGPHPTSLFSGRSTLHFVTCLLP